jgi:hypothetical protein
MSELKVGDQISKLTNNIVDPDIYNIIDIKTIKGGNWHDGYSETIVAKLSKDSINVIEYCLQYRNNMCQINNIYFTKC